ncbi:MAG: rhomboid family intramembrane serine protease [Saprospiraceae bacterium]|nr:rhomboid family intramembrane serine protease [Saprospiraceae bacterium]
MLLGGILFIVIYVLILILSCIPTYIKFKNNPQYASIGASGAISGILFIYILYFPFNLLYLFGMIPVPAIVFGFLYLYYSWWASRNTNDHIDHDAHYYGAVMGLLFGVIIKYLL